MKGQSLNRLIAIYIYLMHNQLIKDIRVSLINFNMIMGETARQIEL